MLHKIGQTVAKLKKIIHILYQKIKQRLSVPQRQIQTKKVDELSNPVKKKSSSKKNTLESDYTLNGKLPSSTFTAKIGDHKIKSENADIYMKKLSAVSKQNNNELTENIGHYITGNEELAGGEEKDGVIVKVETSMEEIERDLAEALDYWKWTQQAYNQALGDEQVDFYIYQMMAAEQKYRMILLKARRLQVNWSKIKGDLV